MPPPATNYKRLPGAANTWTGYHRLWLAADHVLEVRTTTVNEGYRRYFFADIQAVTLRRTSLGLYLNMVFGALLLAFGLVALQVPVPGSYVVLGLGTPFLILLLANVILGPTCVTHIRTAVQNERVPALSRVRTTTRFLGRVRPLILEAQPAAAPPEAPAPQAAAPENAAPSIEPSA